MQLNLLPKIVQRKKKRLGQGHGSGRVKTAGRGTKGQNARSSRPLQFEGGALPLTKRLPFLRGKDRNKPLRVKPTVINLTDLAKFPAKSVIDRDALIKLNIIESDTKNTKVKLLGKGNVEKAYTVKIRTSKSAAEKIIKAGGKVEA